ncbi:hypothetical protein ElyMa_004357700 [Elysia marginata]|uniref:Uncharacterized protein n=1 Tax=Elysia marginata TaxID=1093978 RepID=A0AAV4H5U3_9GAST|nr:hypothetical protein ElyMa_004357700 [Elysia marginata]
MLSTAPVTVCLLAAVTLSHFGALGAPVESGSKSDKDCQKIMERCLERFHALVEEEVDEEKVCARAVDALSCINRCPSYPDKFQLEDSLNRWVLNNAPSCVLPGPNEIPVYEPPIGEAAVNKIRE